nr:sodium- and chloride-dependent glycine transporter 2-like [Halyomorpha halys]
MDVPLHHHHDCYHSDEECEAEDDIDTKRGRSGSLRRFSVPPRRESGSEARTMDAAIRRPSLAALADRGTWGSPWEFLLSCVGLSVGIGNVWRFPYLAYQNGGGKLIIDRVGCAMITVSLIVCIYYNVIMSYTVFYMVASFDSEVPWSKCDPAWADMATCYVRGEPQSLAMNVTIPNRTIAENSSRETASLQYWERYVLKLSDGIENLGPIKWDLALCLLVSWCVVVLCLIKGIKTSGKVVYFAATFPYVILFTLLITGLLQEGAMSGVIYFIYPTWSKLLDIQVWQAAAGQMFFSLSVSMGGLIMYSSYNDFRNNVYRDALVVSVMDTVTSIISGIVTFSILGAMAHDLQVPISQVVKEGPGLAFIAYPEALLRLPAPQLWSVLFFLMLFILGLDSEFALLENVLTSLSDEFPILRKTKLGFCIGTATFCYLIGLTCVTYGGNYVLTLMDVYGGGMAVLFIAIAESIALVWIYGLKNLCRDMKFMLGFRPSFYWRITWVFTTPVILSVIFIYSLIEYKPLHYENYDYPDWADGIGWVLAGLSVLQIPFWAIVVVSRKKSDTFLGKVKEAIKPTKEWGPADPRNKERWAEVVDATNSSKLKYHNGMIMVSPEAEACLRKPV